MRLKFSLALLIGFGLTAGVVSFSDAVACSCTKTPALNSNVQDGSDRVAPEPEVFLEPTRFQSLRDAEDVPDRRVPILYGYPTPEAMEAAKRGEIILGGCFVSPGQPQFGLLPDLVEGEIN
jgi:hypothetical protein